MTNRRRPRTRLSVWKKASYGLLVTGLFFLGSEILLWAFDFRTTLADRDPHVGFASQVPLFVQVEHAGAVALETAKNKLEYFNAQSFPKPKAEGTYRIFCLGGSTTYGRPYDDSTSFVGWLRELLPNVDGSRSWEVINAGGISYASYRVAAVLDELVQYSPDLFIIYTGHNEFLEERSYRDLQASSARFRQLTSWLHRTRTFSLAFRLLSPQAQPGLPSAILPGEVDTLLDHASGPVAYHRNEALRADVLRNFELNLARMIRVARAAGADVLLITPAANLKDFSPFKSEHQTGLDEASRLRWAELMAEATLLEQEGDLSAASELIEQAAEIDNHRADLHYQRGRLQFAQSHFAEARRSFIAAIDEDVCPLRALPAIQRTVERTAVRQRVPLVAFDHIVDNECMRVFGHDSPGHEYFLDHVHPTIATHRLLAQAVMEALTQIGVVSPSQTGRDQAVAVATEAIESRLNPELQARALTNLAQVLSWAGKQDEAGPIAVAAVRLRAEAGLPEDSESLFYAAVYYQTMGSNAQALEMFEKVVADRPRDGQARLRLANLLVDEMQYEQAQVHFVEAARLNPNDAYTHRKLGQVLLELGQPTQALESLRRAQKLAPEDASILSDIHKALELSPNSTAGNP